MEENANTTTEFDTRHQQKLDYTEQARQKHREDRTAATVEESMNRIAELTTMSTEIAQRQIALSAALLIYCGDALNSIAHMKLPSRT